MSPHLQSVRRGLAHFAPGLHPLVPLALIWMVGFALLAAGSDRQPNGHSLPTDVWLIPTGIAIAALCFLLARDPRLSSRDRLPWRLIALGGLTMPVMDGLWALADPKVAIVPVSFAGLGEAATVSLLLVGGFLFRPDRTVCPRPRAQVFLEYAALALVTSLCVWYFILEPLPSHGLEVEPMLVGAIGVLVIVAFSRVALGPIAGLSPIPATVMVLGAGAAMVGAVASGLGPVVGADVSSGIAGTGDNAAALGQFTLALFRLSMIVGGCLELRARASRVDSKPQLSTSPLFYACVACGAVPFAFLVIDLGMRYFLVVAVGLALSAVVVIRQFITAGEADQAERARRSSEARFGWLVRNSSDLIMAVNPQGAIEYVSPSVERLLRTPSAQLIGSKLTDLSHPEDSAALVSLVDRAIAGPGQRVSGEWRLRQADGSWLPVETVASSSNGDFDSRGVVLNTRDLHERKALEQKLTFQAFHDPLTRLANRSLFRERVEHALDRRNPGPLAVLFVDLDNFKTINDSMGHAAGDHVLVETAHRIRSTLRTEDTAARLGGDEFAILLEDAEVTTAARVAERIRVALGTPFWVLGQEVYISASIGIATREIGDTAGDLLRNADVAMYTAKEKGKSRFEVFEPKMHNAVVARLALEAELRRAIERQEFVVYYQPIVRLESGEVIGAEALVRWQHPTKGLVPPMEFIPLAEETGLIVPLGSWVLKQACHQLAAWQKLRGGGDPFVMNVNLSSRQLVREVIAEEVAAAVDDSGIRASWLVLEVTETVLMADPVAAAAALGHIRDLGVRVALDDFGSGYSSLSHLRRFPIDIVKIDKSFVDDVATEGAQSAIARGIIELGRAMQIQTVAEGIEGDEQAEALRTLGCELGQGYFFARPLEAREWAGLLRADLAEPSGESPAPGKGRARASGGRHGPKPHDAAAA